MTENLARVHLSEDKQDREDRSKLKNLLQKETGLARNSKAMKKEESNKYKGILGSPKHIKERSHLDSLNLGKRNYNQIDHDF